MTTLFLWVFLGFWSSLCRCAIRVHPTESVSSTATNHTARLSQLQLIEAQLKTRLQQQQQQSAGGTRPSLRSVSQDDRDAQAKAMRVAESVSAHVAKTNADRSALNEARLKLSIDEEALLHNADESLHATLRKQLESAKATAQQIHADASDAERAAIERKLELKFSELLHSVQSSRMHGAVDPATAAAAAGQGGGGARVADKSAGATANTDSFSVDIKARFARVDKTLTTPVAGTPTASPTPSPPSTTPKKPVANDDMRERQNNNYLRRQKERLKTEL
jgi:hypothetical protein